MAKSESRVRRKRLSLKQLAALVIAFVGGLAAVATGGQKIIDFWKANFANETGLEPIENAVVLPVPEDEPSPLQNATEGGLGNDNLGKVSAVNIPSSNNLHTESPVSALSITSWMEKRRQSRVGDLHQAGFGFGSLPANRLFNTATAQQPLRPAPSPLVVEVVQTPAGYEGDYYLAFDIFLRNRSDDEILLVAMDWNSRLDLPRGDSTAALLAPNAKYKITYDLGGGSGRQGLSPPYRIGPQATGGFRVVFTPKQSRSEVAYLEGAAHHFGAWVVDSRGRTKKVVQLEYCLNPDGGGCRAPTRSRPSDEMFPPRKRQH